VDENKNQPNKEEQNASFFGVLEKLISENSFVRNLLKKFGC